MATAVIALLISELLAVTAALRPLPTGGAPDVSGNITSVGDFLIAFTLGTILLLALLRFTRSRVVFEALFGVALFFGMLAIATVFLPLGVAVLAASGLTLARFIFPRVFLQNVVVVLGISGIAYAVGITVFPLAFAALFAVLALYDIVAVYGTHHMIALFKGLASRGVIVALIIPKTARGWFRPTSSVRPGEDTHLLGTGDLAIPSIFVVSALHDGPVAAFGAALGSLVGLAATQFLFAHQRTHSPMPALPPIATGGILGYLVGRVVSSGGL